MAESAEALGPKQFVEELFKDDASGNEALSFLTGRLDLSLNSGGNIEFSGNYIGTSQKKNLLNTYMIIPESIF